MEGSITKFRADLGLGVIRGDNGRRYRFACEDVCNPYENLVGHEVDFVIESLKPRSIVILDGSPWFAFGRIGLVEKRR